MMAMATLSAVLKARETTLWRVANSVGHVATYAATVRARFISLMSIKTKGRNLCEAPSLVLPSHQKSKGPATFSGAGPFSS
jgi:hypothetical protein